MRWFVRGDIDGFFGLALDNLVQLLVILTFCLGPPLALAPELVFGRILPGAALSLIVGNLYYAWQAKRLAEREGRDDVCALPYGINTPSVFLFLFLVMLPVKLGALEAGATPEEAGLLAWRAGLLACVGSGVIELVGSLVAERIRRATPRAAMLATLAGIAVGFISMPFLFRAFASPVVALVPLAVICLTYFGKVRFRGGLPGGLVAILLGTALAWVTGFEAEPVASAVGFYPPVPVLGDLVAALRADHLAAYMPVILAMGIFNVVGSLQNVESAAAAGDEFPTRPSLAVNGAGTLVGALFGSCFPTTIYIGHPGWKALGARAGYSVANAVFCTAICLTGSASLIARVVPIEAAMAIVVWIALVITAQCFQVTERRHAPAVVIGLLPGIAAWGVFMLEAGLRAGGAIPFTADPDQLFAALGNDGLAAEGVFALEQGALFTAMIWAAATTCIIERAWFRAAIWFAIAAVLAATGLMHSYQITAADVVLELRPAWRWALAYALIAAVVAATPWLAQRQEAAADDADAQDGTRSRSG